MTKKPNKKRRIILFGSIGLGMVIVVVVILGLLGVGSHKTATINGCVFDGLTLEEATIEYRKGKCPEREIEIETENKKDDDKKKTSKVRCSTDDECYKETRDKLTDEEMFIELYNKYDYPKEKVEELLEGKLGLNDMYERVTFRVQYKITRSNIGKVDGRYLTLKDLTAEYSPSTFKDLMIKYGNKMETQTSDLSIEIDFMSILETYDRDFNY